MYTSYLAPPSVGFQSMQNEQHTASYYHQGLGTAGHRVSSSVSYLPGYSHAYSGSSQHLMLQPLQYSQNAVAQNFPTNQYQQQPTYQNQNQNQTQLQASQTNHEEANGGISTVLEYNINNMATFLSWCTFGMLKQNRNPCKQFDDWVVSVLFATRLPKLTIIIALEYMNQRYLRLDQIPPMKETDIFTVLVVSLVLANKFNDDNTFTNRLWSGATGIDITILNREEKLWLQEVNWQLNVVKFESNIRTLEVCWTTWLEKYTNKCNQPQIATPPSPAYTDSSILLSPTRDYNSNYYYSPIINQLLLPAFADVSTKYQDPGTFMNGSTTHVPAPSIWGSNHTYSQQLPPVYHHHHHTPTTQSKIWGGYGAAAVTPITSGVGYAYTPAHTGFMGYNNYYNYSMASC